MTMRGRHPESVILSEWKRRRSRIWADETLSLAVREKLIRATQWWALGQLADLAGDEGVNLKNLAEAVDEVWSGLA